MLAGEYLAGGISIYGEVRNLSVVPVAFGEYLLSFDVEDAHNDNEWVWLVLLDSQILKVLPAAVTSTSIYIPDSQVHSLQIVAVDQYQIQGSYPRIIGDADGYRAFVRWPKSSDASTRSYRVYSDGGTGTIDEVTPVAVITELDTGVGVGLPGSSGSGTLTIWGNTTLSSFNGVLTVEIVSKTAGSSTFRYRYNSGSWTTRDFAEGEVALIDGISIRFDSSLSSYDVGASWTIEIGPRSFYVSDPLAQGEYQYLIKAADVAGNETAIDVGEITLAINPPGDPITGKAVSYDLADDEIVVSWTNPSDVAYTGAKVYANYDRITSTLTPYIIEDGEYANVLAPQSSLTISTPADGTWLFRIKPTYSNKATPDDIDLLTVEVGGKSSDINLSDPYNLATINGPAGQVTLTWEYNYGTGDDLDTWLLYLDETEADVYTDGYQGEITPTLTFDDGVIRRYSYDLGTVLSNQYAGLIAFNSPHGSSGRPTVAVTPDADGPTFAGDLYGASV